MKDANGKVITEEVIPMLPEELTAQKSFEWWGTQECELSPRDSDEDAPRMRDGRFVA